MQQEQWWSTCELGVFTMPLDDPGGRRILDRRHHAHLGHRHHLTMARSRRRGGRITRDLRTAMVTIVRVVRPPGRIGCADHVGVRRQLAGVTKNKEHD